MGSGANGLVRNGSGADERQGVLAVRDGLLHSEVLTLVQHAQLVGVDLAGRGRLALRVQSDLQTWHLHGGVSDLSSIHGDALGGRGGGLNGHSLVEAQLGSLQ